MIEEGDGLSLVSCVLFTDTGGAQKVSEGEFGDLTLNTVHLFCENKYCRIPSPCLNVQIHFFARFFGAARPAPGRGAPWEGEQQSKEEQNHKDQQDLERVAELARIHGPGDCKCQ